MEEGKRASFDLPHYVSKKDGAPNSRNRLRSSSLVQALIRQIEPSRATHGNGSGMAKANLLGFENMNFLGKGNQMRIVKLA